jgi:hypothetical protein
MSKGMMHGVAIGMFLCGFAAMVNARASGLVVMAFMAVSFVCAAISESFPTHESWPENTPEIAVGMMGAGFIWGILYRIVGLPIF